MIRRARQLLLLIVVSAVLGVSGWAFLRFRALKRLAYRESAQPSAAANLSGPDTELWTQGVEKAKADRGEAAGPGAAAEIPPQLRHYTDRHWFLATQVAEVRKSNVQSCQDFVDLAAMIERREMVLVPAVTENYILLGVGAAADDAAFSRYEDDQKLLRDYESLQRLAKNLSGRSFNLDDSTDRKAMKVRMLSSLRPEGLKILEEIAKGYHGTFARPLPVSSLVRPEQYQRALNKVNRNAVLIDIPPHSTGLAFDIDYRYMSGAEQTFLMAALARMEDEGRIEVIRERSANYHVFAFIDGRRPSDELIKASLEEASMLGREAKLAPRRPSKARRKSGTAKRIKRK